MKLKYYLRGLGIGILVSTIILMIAFSGRSNELSDEEIISRAKELGMVMEEQKTGESIPKGTEDTGTEQEPEEADTQPERETQMNGQETETQRPPETQQTDSRDKLVEFTVIKGDTSNSVAARLFAEGLVDDAEKFNEYLMEKKYANSILPRTVEIPKGSSYEELARILTAPK